MRRRRALAVALGVAALAGGVGVTGWLRASVLVVEDLAGARVLAVEPVRPGDDFALEYVHSSERVPVRGTFTVQPDRALRVTATAFGGPGPGLPVASAPGTFRIEGGMLVQDSDVDLTELRLRVAPLTRHRLRLVSGKELDLSAAMGSGGPVGVRVEARGWRLVER